MGNWQDILTGSDHRFICRQEMLNAHTVIVASDWQKWVPNETKRVVTHRYKWTGLTCTDGNIAANIRCSCPLRYAQYRMSATSKLPFLVTQHDIALRGIVGAKAMSRVKCEFHG
jgi:hypothetical protein